MTSRNLLPLATKLAVAWPADDWGDVTVLVAVSGGPDSVALLRALAQLKTTTGGAGRLIVAHLDHRLRPDSAQDAAFVVNLAKQLGLPLEQERGDVKQTAALCGDGIEAAARQARYDFFQRVAQRVGARYVATGHTADDQVETVLFNLLRGTGLSGLAGMPRARPLGPTTSLIRPLLNLRRTEVTEYLDQLKQEYRIDSSNADVDLTRNRIRHELLPMLRERFNTDVDQAIGRLAMLAADAQCVIEHSAEQLLDGCLAKSDSTEVRLNLTPLAATDRHLVREMFVALWRKQNWPLQQMGFAQWDALAAMALAKQSEAPDCRTFPENIIARRHEAQLVLSSPNS